MARNKDKKFVIYAAKRYGRHKGERFMLINDFYEGGTENITVEDLINFLKEHDIDPKRVPLRNFMAYVKPATD